MLVIGIAGGSGSGKTTVVRAIIEKLKNADISVLPQDAYYKDLTHIPLEERKKVNFDHPDSIEFSLLCKHISQLKNNQPIQLPKYDYITCTRSHETIPVLPSKILIIEGILIFTHEELRNQIDIKVYVDANPDDRLIRIIRRDTIERGRTYQQALEHYEKFVKPMHEVFIEPTKRFADIIIPQGGANQIAIDILTQFVKQKLLFDIN
ncbi:MAG: uridine kinase [Bacteroidales bacterium]|nr:uridine kinase [Bacteroidales bacterium]